MGADHGQSHGPSHVPSHGPSHGQSDGHDGHDGHTTDDPCSELVHTRQPVEGGRVRVVEVMATGTNGGAQEHVYSLVTRMDRDCYDVRVVSLSHGSSVRRLEKAGIQVDVIDEPDDRAAVRALAELLGPLEPEIIHNHMFRAEVVGTRAALLLGEEGCRRPAVISTVHSSRVRCADDRLALRQLTPLMDRLIVVSKAIERKIREEGRVGAPVSLIYNGVDLQRYNHQQPCCTLHDEYRIPESSPIVGVVARLEAEKGHRTLIEAWPQVLEAQPEAWLLIVGEGSERNSLEAQAASMGISNRVVFTGRREDVPAVTAALDVSVLPSYREAQGLSVLEAMALSRPVVASNVGGIPEMVEDGVSGLLVPPGDPDALAGAIVKVLSDHPYADMMAKRGHDLVHERFCIELMTSSIESLYDDAARKLRASARVAR